MGLQVFLKYVEQIMRSRPGHRSVDHQQENFYRYVIHLPDLPMLFRPINTCLGDIPGNATA